ncbi:hypothetical protein M513_12756 [Trichuris suis]|uniref:Uncharacterized protein n=1 Tax=Trichuris suis TaxID=68888 RepID=A0A085LN39_9BILA|nr:hypothetical protein M513_12756 [Trichuris suis]
MPVDSIFLTAALWRQMGVQLRRHIVQCFRTQTGHLPPFLASSRQYCPSELSTFAKRFMPLPYNVATAIRKVSQMAVRPLPG